MKQMSQVRRPRTAPIPSARDAMPAEPLGAISDADLDRVSGGGGAAGGVIGSRGRSRDN